MTRRAGAGARVHGRDPPRPKAPGREAAPDRRGAGCDAGAPREPDGPRCPRLDEWVDVRGSRLADLDALLSKLRSSDIVELEVLDDEGERRGNLMAQVIGQGLDEQLGVSCIFIYPLAAEKREVLDWAIANLAAPNAVHFCRRPAQEIDLSGAADFVQKVERWRIRDAAKVTETWAAHAVLRDAGPLAMKKALPEAPGEPEEIVLRPLAMKKAHPEALDEPEEIVLQRKPMKAMEKRKDRERVMDEVSQLGRELLGDDAADDGFPPKPPGDEGPGAGEAAADGERRGRAELKEGLDTPVPTWEHRAGAALMARACRAKAGTEDGLWSVRERLSARAGRVHQRREARRVGRDTEAPASSMPEESEAEYVLPKKQGRKRRRRSRDRRRRRRRGSGSRGRSSSSPTLSSRGSSSSRSDFRGASNVAATSSRAARDSVAKPHLVLVDTLAQMCQAPPKSTEEAATTRASIYRRLPSVFLAWFSLTLLPAMKAKPGMLRNESESRTLVEALDGLVKGEQLPVFMPLLGRLKALSSVVLAEGTWALAQQHELTRTNATGILTDRDQRHAQRDLRDQQRLEERARGAPPAGRADR